VNNPDFGPSAEEKRGKSRESKKNMIPEPKGKKASKSSEKVKPPAQDSVEEAKGLTFKPKISRGPKKLDHSQDFDANLPKSSEHAPGGKEWYLERRKLVQAYDKNRRKFQEKDLEDQGEKSISRSKSKDFKPTTTVPLPVKSQKKIPVVEKPVPPKNAPKIVHSPVASPVPAPTATIKPVKNTEVDAGQNKAPPPEKLAMETAPTRQAPLGKVNVEPQAASVKEIFSPVQDDKRPFLLPPKKNFMKKTLEMKLSAVKRDSNDLPKEVSFFGDGSEVFSGIRRDEENPPSPSFRMTEGQDSLDAAMRNSVERKKSAWEKRKEQQRDQPIGAKGANVMAQESKKSRAEAELEELQQYLNSSLGEPKEPIFRNNLIVVEEKGKKPPVQSLRQDNLLVDLTQDEKLYLQKCFGLLDSDQDGTISAVAVDLSQLNLKTLEILEEVLGDLEDMDMIMNFPMFVNSLADRKIIQGVVESIKGDEVKREQSKPLQAKMPKIVNFKYIH
jgi:hypothetical protein